MSAGFAWDPAQYARFAEERARPFRDLIARVPAGEGIGRVADLGCGTGELTREMLARWPRADILGIDNSPAMLAAAARLAPDRRLAFAQADIAGWNPVAPADAIVSNAALHWVPDHPRLLPRLVGMLAPGGWLAVQVPYNQDEPCHALYDGLRAEARWTARLGPAAAQYATREPLWYGRSLAGLGCAVDLWETVYTHPLADAGAVVEWVKGTLLRPTLAKLGPGDAETFLAEYRARVAAAYPLEAGYCWLRYRRLFFVARRPPG